MSGTGDPILLVHGAATWSADWLLVLPLLRDRFQVVTMDRRGRGRSGDAPDYSIDREAEDVLAVLEAVEGDLLVGHSYGALCSIMAADRSERLRRLVLYEPPIAVRKDAIDRAGALVAAGNYEAALEGFLSAAGASDDQLAAIRSSQAWPGLLDAVPALPRELRECGAWRHPRGPIEVPTLFLLGGDTTSPVYLDGLDQLEAAFTDARRERITGQLHVGHVFAAEAFAELVAEFCAPAGEPRRDPAG